MTSRPKTEAPCPRPTVPEARWNTVAHYPHYWGDPQDENDHRWCSGVAPVDDETREILAVLGFDPDQNVADISRSSLISHVVLAWLRLRTCALRRHPLCKPLHLPEYGDRWACACGKRVGGRVY